MFESLTCELGAECGAVWPRMMTGALSLPLLEVMMVHDSSCGRGVVYPGVDAVIATRAFPRGSRYACPLCPTMPLRGVMTALLPLCIHLPVVEHRVRCLRSCWCSSPSGTAPWMHWRLDRRVLTVNWSDAMEAGMLELHRGPIPGRPSTGQPWFPEASWLD